MLNEISKRNATLILLSIVGIYLLDILYHVSVASCATFVLLAILHPVALKMINKQGDWKNVIGSQYRFIFGDLPNLQASKDGQYLRRLKETFGNPKVYRIWMGFQPTLILSHPDAVREFWQNQDEKIIDRDVKLGWPVKMLMEHAIGLKSYSERNRMSKFFHSCFGANRIAQFNSNIEFETNKIIDRLGELTVHDQIIDISSELRYLTFNICGEFFLGPKWIQYEKKFLEMNDSMFDFMWLTYNATWLNLPCFRWFLPKNYKLYCKIDKFRRELDFILHRLMEQYREELKITGNLENEEDGDSILVRFVKKTAQNNCSVTYRELMDTIIEGFLFPTDLSSTTFTFTLILLSWNDNIQTKTRERIREQLQQKDKCEKDPLKLSDLRSISYLDWILKEAQRLLPVFIFNIPEFTSQEMTICGVTVPKNTMTTYDVQSLNRGEDVWDEPFVFRPERFELLNEKQTKAIHAFGNGRSRRCLGEFLIKSLHKYLIARILLQFRIESLDENRDIDQIPRQLQPYFIAPTVKLRLIPI